MRFYDKGRKKQGSVLILVIWVLTMLCIFSIALGYSVRQILRTVQYLDVRDNLRFIAESGVVKAVHVLNQKSRVAGGVDHLNSRWANSESDFKDVPLGDGSFSVCYEEETPGGRTAGDKDPSSVHYGIVDEERKVNINRVKEVRVFKKIFQYGAGIEEADASAIAGALLDWRDADEFPNDQGAESSYYRTLQPPYAAKNSNFETLEELIFVKGVTPGIYQKVAPFLTIENSGRVNINTVPPEILRACGFNDSLVKKIMTFRLGADKIRGTRDDMCFTSIPTLAADLGLSDAERQSLESFMAWGIFTVISENFTIRSVARLNRRRETLTVTCIVERTGKVRRWREEFGVLPEGEI